MERLNSLCLAVALSCLDSSTNSRTIDVLRRKVLEVQFVQLFFSIFFGVKKELVMGGAESLVQDF